MNKKEAQKRVIPFSDFDMISVKYNSKTGLKCVYVNKATGRHEDVTDDKNAPHPDLLNALKELSPNVGYILGLRRGWDAARELAGKDLDLLDAVYKGEKEADSQFTVSGIRLAGEGKNASVKITGSLKCLTGATGLASPLINFQNTALGIEQTIEGICGRITEEVYNFLYLGKIDAEQHEMDFEDDRQLNIEVESEKVNAD